MVCICLEHINQPLNTNLLCNSVKPKHIKYNGNNNHGNRNNNISSFNMFILLLYKSRSTVLYCLLLEWCGLNHVVRSPKAISDPYLMKTVTVALYRHFVKHTFLSSVNPKTDIPTKAPNSFFMIIYEKGLERANDVIYVDLALLFSNNYSPT